jgi:hypothetical protein
LECSEISLKMVSRWQVLSLDTVEASSERNIV